MPKIKVTVNKFGDTKVEVEDAFGSQCLSLTAGVEAALNGQAQTRELKPEYHYEVNQDIVENG